MRFLRANAAEFCIDSDRIAVMGESAGGTLASLTGVTAGMEEYERGEWLDTSSAVQAVVDIYGLTDLSIVPEHSADANVADWTIEAFLGGVTPEKIHKASAVNYVGDATPPFMILHGSADVTVDIANSETLYDRLIAHGIPAEYYVLEGAAHGDDRFYQEPVYALIDDFLKRNMG